MQVGIISCMGGALWAFERIYWRSNLIVVEDLLPMVTLPSSFSCAVFFILCISSSLCSGACKGLSSVALPVLFIKIQHCVHLQLLPSSSSRGRLFWIWANDRLTVLVFSPSLLYISVEVPNIGNVDQCSSGFSLPMKKYALLPLCESKLNVAVISHFLSKMSQFCFVFFLTRRLYPLSQLKTKRSIISEWVVAVTRRFNQPGTKTFVH